MTRSTRPASPADQRPEPLFGIEIPGDAPLPRNIEDLAASTIVEMLQARMFARLASRLERAASR